MSGSQLMDSHECTSVIVLNPEKGRGDYGWCKECGALFDRSNPSKIFKRVPEWSFRVPVAETVVIEA